MLTLAQILQRVQSGSPIQFVHLPHPSWPFPRHVVKPASTTLLQIAVLDSSFNCPTRAHQALAQTKLPNIFAQRDDTGIDSIQPLDDMGKQESDYDARLLLLSVQNADKVMKSGDATYLQRMEMMKLLAQDMDDSAEAQPASTQNSEACDANVAIAIVNDPTFVQKSRILVDAISTRLRDLAATESLVTYPPTQDISSSSFAPPQLLFLMGMDTVERIFQPRYYPPTEGSGKTNEETMREKFRVFLSDTYSTGDNSRLVCATRDMQAQPSKSEGAAQAGADQASDLPVLAQEYMKAEPPKIAMVDIGSEERTWSSSAVRKGIREGDASWKSMVSGRIAQYIEKEGLYKS